MLESLERLSEFRDDSLVWSGHEYALDNLQFAKHIDPKNESVVSKKAWVKIQREQGQPTVSILSRMNDVNSKSVFDRVLSSHFMGSNSINWRSHTAMLLPSALSILSVLTYKELRI
jgi:hypothetical protein